MKYGYLKKLSLRLAGTAILLSAGAGAKELEIRAGDHAWSRGNFILASPGALPENPALESAGGEILPLQEIRDGGLSFTLPELAAGASARFKLVSSKSPAPSAVTVKIEGDQIHFIKGERPIASYQAAAKTAPRPDLDPLFLRGGYLHPLFTPSGKTVTDDYAANHLHHHGIWMAWTKAKYDGRETDFWNMGQGKGKVDFVSLEKSWSGPVQAGLISHHKYTDLTSGKPIDVLAEKWTVEVPAAGDSYHVIDLLAEQSVIGSIPLELPVYHYGGLGVRGPGEWNGKDKATFITSEAATDRIQANGQPARWVRMTGLVAGGSAGIAVLSHPDNFRSPQPARLHPTEPFISFAPQTNAAMEIKPGETYRARYRFIISDGEADVKLLENLWQNYAHPPTADWKE